MAFWLRYTVIFAIIFATSAVYNCYLLSNKVILLLDSSHYLITVRHLHAFCLQALGGHLDQGWTTLCSPQAAADIMIDGPILPAIGALGFLLSGMQPLATNWAVLAVTLSVLLALMGCCVGITVENCIARSKYSAVIGCAASLIAGSNPEGLIAASRFLTELPSAAILALIVALSSTIFLRKVGPNTTAIIYFLLPLLAMCGFLLKPALLLANFLLPAIVLFKAMLGSGRKTAISILMIMICGLGTILVPWCVYTIQATGQVHLSPERMPLFNLAKGNDVAVDGYSSDPSARSSHQIEQLGSASKIISTTWYRDPQDLAALYLRKLQRMVMTPWNDFMQTPYGICEAVTRLLHYYLILSALAGIAKLSILSSKTRPRAFYGLLGIIVASTLTLYAPFEGICRYSYPISPLFFIFASLWHLAIFSKKSSDIKKMASCNNLAMPGNVLYFRPHPLLAQLVNCAARHTRFYLRYMHLSLAAIIQ